MDPRRDSTFGGRVVSKARQHLVVCATCCQSGTLSVQRSMVTQPAPMSTKKERSVVAKSSVGPLELRGCGKLSSVSLVCELAVESG